EMLTLPGVEPDELQRQFRDPEVRGHLLGHRDHGRGRSSSGSTSATSAASASHPAGVMSPGTVSAGRSRATGTSGYFRSRDSWYPSAAGAAAGVSRAMCWFLRQADR